VNFQWRKRQLRILRIIAHLVPRTSGYDFSTNNQFFANGGFRMPIDQQLFPRIAPVYLLAALALTYAVPCVSQTGHPVITEYPVLSAPLSGLQEIVTGSDGALWFSEYAGPTGTSKIGRITTAGVITEYPIPSGTSGFSGPQGITEGPDGDVWFAESVSNKIGRLSTTGVLTEYPLSPTSGRPVNIAAGPDGAIWFTEYDSNKIGRITTAGVITEYPIPTPNSLPEGITAGPDGALWFIEFTSNKIGRITTTGAINEYPAPSPGGLSDIVAGPDGALWFNEFRANKIGRITTAGVITEYPVPTPNSLPEGNTAGTGGTWFAEYNSNQIAFITTAGVITEYTVPTPNSGPHAVTAGPDGAMWFTETLANQIGRIAFITPPTISGMPAAGCKLWPPNQKLILVATITVSDNTIVDPATLTVNATNNQPVAPNDPMYPDVVITPTSSGGYTVQLRADRLATVSTDRIYTITATARDLFGNVATATATCTVPHDQGN
jgi:streptogramin lyase